MITLQLLNAFTSVPYRAMTFPHFQPRLMSAGIHDSTIAIGSSCDGRPVGLALADIANDGRSAMMLSVCVVAALRNRGIGTSLVAQLEKELQSRSCTRLACAYLRKTQSTLAVERLLVKRDWTRPETRMLVCHGQHGRILEAPGIKRCRLPAAFSIVSWCELSSEDRETIQQSQAVQPWYPDTLSPFRDEHILEPMNSLGLRHQEQIVGWLILHVAAKDVVRYSSFFVREDLRDEGCGLPLLAEAFRRRVTSHGPDSVGSFGVRIENPTMVRFVRRLTPFLLSVRESKHSFKAL